MQVGKWRDRSLSNISFKKENKYTEQPLSKGKPETLRALFLLAVNGRCHELLHAIKGSTGVH